MLIAKKPCSFGGQQFFMGNRIPNELVINPEQQEKLGVLAVVNGNDFMHKDTSDSANHEELIQIAVKGTSDETLKIMAEHDEIRQVFDIMQTNADESIKLIADVTSENVLILLHAADSRKTIKNAAKEQADKLFSHKSSSNESEDGNKVTDTSKEGADA